MKRSMVLGIFGMLFSIVSYAQSVDTQEPEPQKVYVEPEQLSFTNKAIFAFVAGEWVAVNAVNSDDNGVYIAAVQTRWICPLCLYNNRERAKTCERWYEVERELCGYPRP